MRGKMHGKVTYHQQISYCGKPRCRKCSEGIGHGPYWYAYETIDGHTTRTYIGKQLPADIHEQHDAQQTQSAGIGDPSTNVETPFAPLTDSASHPLGTAATPATIPATSASPILPTQPTYRLFLLGQTRLERRRGQQWQVVSEAAWQHAHVRSLLSYLVSSPGRKASRVQLRADLWADEDEEQANKALSSSVRLLRQLFAVSNRGSGALDSRERPNPTNLANQPPLLHSDSEEFTLADQQQIWVDVDAFAECLATSALDDALTLYGGDFFPEERSAAWALTRRQF